MQAFLHRVLQLLALQVVVDLVGRRLANVQNGFACQMLWLDLLTHRSPRCPGGARFLRNVPVATALADACSPAESPSAMFAKTRSRVADETGSVGLSPDGWTCFAWAPSMID